MDQTRSHSAVDDQYQSATQPKRPRIDSQDSDGINHISKLPTSILANIIRCFPMAKWPNFELVDHSFQEATFEVWRKVREFNFERDLCFDRQSILIDETEALTSALQKLAIRAPSLERIRSDKSSITCSALTKLFSNASIQKNLKELTLIGTLNNGQTESGSTIDQKNGNRSLRLEKLVYECGWYQNRCAYAFLIQIDESKLTILSLDVTKYNRAAITALLDRCTKLVQLKLKLAVDSYGELFHVASTSQVLTKLKLKVIRGQRSEFYAAMENLIQNLGGRQLTELSLDPCSDSVVGDIGSHLRYLISLDIDVYSVYEHSIDQLLMALNRLEYLRFRTLNSDMLVKIAPFLAPNLKSLNIHLSQPHPNGLGFVDVLTSLHQLNRLHFELSSFDNGDLFTKLAENGGLPQLEQLHIETSKEMDEKLIPFLATLHSLRRLRLTQNSHTTSDTILKAIAGSLPLLCELDISSNERVTAAGIQSIIDGCTDLTKIRARNLKRQKTWFPEELKIDKNRCIRFE